MSGAQQKNFVVLRKIAGQSQCRMQRGLLAAEHECIRLLQRHICCQHARTTAVAVTLWEPYCLSQQLQQQQTQAAGVELTPLPFVPSSSSLLTASVIVAKFA